MECLTCGFSPAHWSTEQAASTLRIVNRWYDLLAEDASPELLRMLVPLADRIAAVVGNRDASVLDRVHDAVHALHEAGRCRRRTGEGAPPATGRLVQLNVSGGGVPKSPVPRATLTTDGMAGDRQNDREHHGRPWQAVCLWSAEVIDALAAEGHPIGYGKAGENVTVAGIDWLTLRPGVRLAIGSALVETTPYAIPCRKNAPWFLGGDFGRMAHERQPGVSRIYAQVLRPGSVAVGDPVIVEPEPVEPQAAAGPRVT
ncbi:MAG: MOSC domain-containing protein [Frankiaceae bacterium]